MTATLTPMADHLEQATRDMLKAMSEGSSMLDEAAKNSPVRALPTNPRIGSEAGLEGDLMRSQLNTLDNDEPLSA
jgi:hypothetical protein